MRLFTLLVSALFVAVGIWMIVDGDSTGWFVAGFFGLCLLVAVFEPWLPKPQVACEYRLVITEEDVACEHPKRPRMECYTSKVKLLGLLGLTCAMVSVSYFCTTLPGLTPRVVGWMGVGFFGLGFIALPVMFFRAAPQVVINDEGIEDRRLKIGVIRWEDIRSLSIGSVHSAKFLCVEVADPERYSSRLPRWSRWLAALNEALGFPALTIGFSGLSPGLNEAWAYLQARDSMNRALHPERYASEPRAPLEPESRFVVRLSDSEVVCERPDGKVERVGWADLQKVEVVTTGDGPFAPDVFWVLHGTDGGCAVPQGATGDSQLLERLQTLPGFDNHAFIEAMSSTSDRRFLCWKRTA